MRLLSRDAARINGESICRKYCPMLITVNNTLSSRAVLHSLPCLPLPRFLHLSKGSSSSVLPHATPSRHAPSPDLLYVSKERMIAVKSCEFLKTKEWDKYPILIMMIISGAGKI